MASVAASSSEGRRGGAYRAVAAAVAAAAETAGRSEAPLLVAVSKRFPAEAVQEVYDAGARVFGENYVQELVAKAPALPDDIEWHFIGSLQSNKAKALVAIPNLAVVQTLHSNKLAKTLNKAAADADRTLDVYIQVNTSGEESKSGVEPEAVLELARYVAEQCPALKLAGLMTIGSRAASINAAGGETNPDFEVLATAAAAIGDAGLRAAGDARPLVLSMGMSADFEQAILQGSTCVRVGSAIFGAREYPAKA